MDLFLDLSALDTRGLDFLRRQAERAAGHFEPGDPAFELFTAVGFLTSREEERRGAPVNRFPLRVNWSLPDDLPHRAADFELEKVISYLAAVVANASGPVHTVWKALAVQLAEERDRRRLSRRFIEELEAQIAGYRGRLETDDAA